MKSYTGLIPRYLKKQTKRSLLAIIGVALSIALMVSTGTLAVSIRYSEVDHAIAHSGSYHASFEKLSADKIDIISRHAKIKASGVSSPLGDYKLNENGIYVNAASYDESALKMQNFQLVSGKLPQAAGDIALEEWVLDEMNPRPSPGDRIHLNYSRSKKNNMVPGLKAVREDFNLTGILKSKTTSKITGHSKAIVSNKTIDEYISPENISYNAFIEISSQFPIRQTIKEIQDSLNIDDRNVYFNESLLLALGERNTIDWPLLFLAFIVMAATVAAIYNVFHISVLERIHQFGLLRSVGTTPRQIKKIIFGEALILGFISIPLGIGIGILFIEVLVHGVSLLGGVVSQLVIPLWVLLGAAVIGLISVFLSVYRPAHLAAKVSPLEAIRIDSSMLKEDIIKQKRWHSIIERFMGVSGKMAYQNLWRHKKRFLTTIFSMCIGIILFIIFSYFVSGAIPSKMIDEMPGEYSLNISSVVPEAGYNQDDINSISDLKGISQVFKTQYTFTNILYPEDKLNMDYRQYLADRFNYNIQKDPDTGLFSDSASLYGYSDNILELARKYLVEGRIEPEKMAVLPEVLIINTYNNINISKFKVGDEITIRQPKYENDKLSYTDEKKFKIAGILSGIPVQTSFWASGIGIIAHESLFREYTGMNIYKRLDVKVSKDYQKDYIEANLRMISQKSPQGRFVSLEEEIKNMQEQKMQLAILLYLLVAVIVMIGIFSIINTISTNLILRTREFGILRAVGMTVEELKRMIRFEGLYYGLISSFWGTITGSLLAYVLFNLAKKEMTYLVWTIPWQAILLSWAGTILLGIIGTTVPLKRISNINIINSIKTID